MGELLQTGLLLLFVILALLLIVTLWLRRNRKTTTMDARLNSSSNNTDAATTAGIRIIPRKEHPISRKDISDSALKVLYRLKDAGYESYLVGGCVRDLLLGKHPKDFDVATEATPEQVNELFRNSRLIGRRFKLVHVRFGREIIEVATFRASHDAVEDEDQVHGRQSDVGMLIRDNVYGTVHDDAVRRDFTVNALYYSINDFGIHDHANGVEDLENQTLRMIGEPTQRYREDPVRMLRAIRFAAKLEFTLSPETEAPIRELAPLLEHIPAARLFDEVLKLLLSGHAVTTFYLLREFNLFHPLFPATSELLDEEQQQGDECPIEALIIAALKNTDRRIKQGKTITPAFLYAALLWHPLQRRMQQLRKEGLPVLPALHQAAQEVTSQQCQATSIPRRFSTPMREIWDMQYRLPRRFGRRAEQLIQQPRFRAGYDFLLLRETSGEQLDGLGDWWTQYQHADHDERENMINNLEKPSKPFTRRRRSRRKSNS